MPYPDTFSARALDFHMGCRCGRGWDCRCADEPEPARWTYHTAADVRADLARQVAIFGRQHAARLASHMLCGLDAELRDLLADMPIRDAELREWRAVVRAAFNARRWLRGVARQQERRAV